MPLRAKYIKKADFERLQRALAYNAPLFQLMRETGMRVGDAIAVRAADFRRDESGAPVVEIIAQKTGKKLVAEISAELFAKLSTRTGFCFPSPRGYGHISRSTAWRWLKAAAKQCGVDPRGVSPHSVRKCFAVEKLHRDGLEAVREALQHSNSAVTRLYAYADTVGNPDSDEPMRWRDLDMICDYILDRLTESGYNCSRQLSKGDVPRKF